MEVYNHRNDWYYEGEISRILIEYFSKQEYEILKDNSANISSKGEDIIVSFNGMKEIIEVKGYPTTFYTLGPKKGQPKPTKPTLQAKHWFSEALLSTIFNYQKHKNGSNFSIALAFPKFDRYLNLISKVEDFFTDNDIDIKVYLISKEGNIEITNLNRNKRDL